MQQDRRSKRVYSQTITSVAAAPPDSQGAPRAGAELRNARERLEWPLEAVAQWLHIRPAYLAALEEGRLDRLPGNTYALGYLRCYASALGLDADEMVRRFKNEAQEVTHKVELTFPAPAPERGLPAGALVLLGVVLMVIAYAGWYRLSGEGRLPAETMAIPERLAPLAQQAVPPTPVSPAQPVIPPADAPKPVEFAEQREPNPPPVPAVSPASAAAAAVPTDAPPQPPASQEGSRITIRASADSWLQVREKTGQILLNRTLHTGDTWAVPNRPGLVMTTGNAGGTELLVDGAAAAPLGGPGMVRRDLPLDPDLVKDGRLAVVTTPRPQ